MKHLLQLAVPFVRLLLMLLLILAAEHAAPDFVWFGAAGLRHGEGKAVVSDVGKDPAKGVINGTRIDLSRSRTCPITITKIRPLTKMWGMFNGNKSGLILLVRSNLSNSGRRPEDLQPPRPAGRSP